MLSMASCISSQPCIARYIAKQGCIFWGCGVGSDEDEAKVKQETMATLRCIPFDQPCEIGACLMTGKDAQEVAVFAKAY